MLWGSVCTGFQVSIVFCLAGGLEIEKHLGRQRYIRKSIGIQPKCVAPHLELTRQSRTFAEMPQFFRLTSVMFTFLKKEKKLFSNMVVCVPIRGLFRYFVFVRGSDTNKTHRKTDIRANIGIPSACARQVSLTKMLLSSCSE